MYRAFIRFSLNNDNGTLTTYLSNLLTNAGAGFVKVGTGEYHTEGLTAHQLAQVMGLFWNAVENPQAAFPGANIPSNAHVDHIWTYSGMIQA